MRKLSRRFDIDLNDVPKSMRGNYQTRNKGIFSDPKNSQIVQDSQQWPFIYSTKSLQTSYVLGTILTIVIRNINIISNYKKVFPSEFQILKKMLNSSKFCHKKINGTGLVFPL